MRATAFTRQEAGKMAEAPKGSKTQPLRLKQMAGHLIRRMHQISTQTFQVHMRAAGGDLTSVQYAALEAIRSAPGSDQATVSALIAYDKATIGGVVERLVSKGLVAREVSATDRRARVLHLTDKGNAELDRLAPVVAALQDEILSPLSPEERQTFVALAQRITGQETGT